MEVDGAKDEATVAMDTEEVEKLKVDYKPGTWKF